MNNPNTYTYVLLVGAVLLFAIARIFISDVPAMEWLMLVSLIPFAIGAFKLWPNRKNSTTTSPIKPKVNKHSILVNLLLLVSIISAIVISLGIDTSEEMAYSFTAISVFTVPVACVLLLIGRAQIMSSTMVMKGFFKFFLVWVLGTLGIFVGTKESEWVISGVAFQVASALLFLVVFRKMNSQKTNVVESASKE